MCGIVGYIGKRSGVPVVLKGLEALEYRGYDSAGIATIDGKDSKLVRQVGRVEGLVKAANRQRLLAPLAIGHTRWATHGSPTIQNAHPHTNQAKTIFVVHNGIIENYTDIKARLQKEGYKFATETDTEVIPHLIDYYKKKLGSFEAAFKATLKDLRGAYAVAAISTCEPDTIMAARLSSPLVIGVGKSEHILASDPTALMEHTKRVIYLDDYDVATIKAGKLAIHNLKRGKSVNHKAELLDFDNEQAQLGDYPHFMLKEIYEAPATIRLKIW
jgi:glucosamine--fructose-6-phosphate aminotransferase (isomerizing)